MDFRNVDPLLLIIISLPIVFIGLYYVIYSFPSYSTKNDISLAGTKLSPKKNLFMTLFTIYGSSIVYVGIRMIENFPDFKSVKIFALIAIVNGVLTMLVGLIPKDGNKLGHNIVSYGAFIVLSLSYLSGLILFLGIGFIPLILFSIINLALLFTLGYRTVVLNKFDGITWRIEWSSLFLSIIYFLVLTIFIYLS